VDPHAFKAELTALYASKPAAQQFAEEISNELDSYVEPLGEVTLFNGRLGVRAVLKRRDPQAKLLLPKKDRTGTWGSSSSNSSVPLVTWEYSSRPTGTLTVHLQTYNLQQEGSQLARDVCLWLLVVLFLNVPANSHPKKFKEDSPWGKLKAAAAAAAAAAGDSG
jgi:hypothetical protein